MRSLALIAMLVALAGTASADGAAPVPAEARLSLASYLSRVGRGNLELAAQRAALSVAEAQIAIAKLFPDPMLTASLSSVDVSRTQSPTVAGLGVTQTVELGGKRGARVATARNELSGAQAALEDFLRTLRGDATDAFIEALARRKVVERKRQTLASLERLVAVNEQRLKSGDVGDIAVVQSRVESGKFHGELLAAQADVRTADLALLTRLGSIEEIGESTPSGDLHMVPRAFELEELIRRAPERRPDLRASRLALEASRSRLRLARANRWIDLTLGLGWQHSFASSVFMQTAYDSLNASLSLPLPFSYIYRGELSAAEAGRTVSEWQVRGVELKIAVELRQAWARYQIASERVALYDGGLLRDADHVLEAKLYSYQRGAVALLEVLEAQRTVNDVYLAYIDALAEHAHSLVALELAAGIWDLAF